MKLLGASAGPNPKLVWWWALQLSALLLKLFYAQSTTDSLSPRFSCNCPQIVPRGVKVTIRLLCSDRKGILEAWIDCLALAQISCAKEMVGRVLVVGWEMVGRVADSRYNGYNLY